MQNVQFDEPNVSRMTYAGPPAPKIVQWVMRLSGGRIRDQKTATMVLLGGAVALIVIAIHIFSTGTARRYEHDPDHLPRGDGTQMHE